MQLTLERMGKTVGSSVHLYPQTLSLVPGAVTGWFAEWFSLEQEPTVWISFVLSMVCLVFTLRKG